MLGNIVVALLLSFVFIFTELVLLESWTRLLIPACLAFGLSLIRELIKDLHDYQGDKKYGLHTLPVAIGINNTVYFIICISILFSIICFIPFLINIYGINYLISLIFLIEIPLFILVFLLLKKSSNTTYNSLAVLTKYMVINGLIVLYITTI